MKTTYVNLRERLPVAPAVILLIAALLAALAVACGDAAPSPTPSPEPPTPAPTSALAGGPGEPAASPTPASAATPTEGSLAATPTAGSPGATVTASPTPAPSVGAAPAGDGERNAYGVPADPDYAESLAASRIRAAVWETDFRFHVVPYEEVLSGGVGRDGIPPIDEPSFVPVGAAREWLADAEPVIALEYGGEAKAYPLQILIWHEIVNDDIAGLPVAATYCPLCNSALVFERELDGALYDFGVSGNLRNSDLIMWDRQTQSWWQQLTGEAIAGELAGARLRVVPAQIVSWDVFADAYPDGLVLDRPGASRPYGSNPYVGYDAPNLPPFLYRSPTDPRLPPKERVAAVEINGQAAAFPYSRLAEERVVHYEVGGEPVVVFFQFGAASALGAASIAQAADVGSTGVFRPSLDGRALTFAPGDGDGGAAFTDDETGSGWSILGAAVSGPLAGAQLPRLEAQDHFWFAWAAFKPDTLVYGSS